MWYCLGYGRCPVYRAFPYGSERPHGFGILNLGNRRRHPLWCLLPLAIWDAPYWYFPLVFANHQQADSPYLLIIRMDMWMKAQTSFALQVVKRMTLKSKTITGGQGTELIFEICPKTAKVFSSTKSAAWQGCTSVMVLRRQLRGVKGGEANERTAGI